MLEKQKRAIEVQDVGPLESKALMGETQLGKALRASAPECHLLLVCLYMFAAVIVL